MNLNTRLRTAIYDLHKNGLTDEQIAVEVSNKFVSIDEAVILVARCKKVFGRVWDSKVNKGGSDEA